MVILALISLLLMEVVNSQVVCHSDCVPYKCHGPTSRNCNECGPNMVLVGDQCQCMAGWFDDSSGRCHLNVPYCLSVYWDGAAGIWKCSQCETSRDTLNSNGSCTRDLVTPFFSRSGAGLYTGSTTNKADVDFFFANRCKTMDSLGKCLDCYANARLNSTTGICQVLNPQCAVLDPANPSRCLTAASGFYVNTTTGQVGYCFFSCKSCTGPGPFDCLSCSNKYYFQKQPNVITGTCLNCDSSCYSCYGPSNLNCTRVFSGSYVERQDSATLNQVKNCSSGCYSCEDGSNCPYCNSLKTSLSGTCTATANNLSPCKYQYNSSSTSAVCLRWNNNYLTDAGLSKYVTSTTYFSTWNNCLKINQRLKDRITYDCAECDSPDTKMYDSGFCKQVIPYTSLNPPLPLNCESSAYYSYSNASCMTCSQGYILLPNRTCDTTCPAYSDNGRPLIQIVTWTGLDSSGNTIYKYTCAMCPVGCLSCQQEGGVGSDIICSVCDSSSGYILYKGMCSSLNCNANSTVDPNPSLSYTKQCDLSISGTSTYQCTTDCMFYDSTLCSSQSSCFRKMFGLNSTGTNIAVLSIVADYVDYLDFDVMADLLVDTPDATAPVQQVFCNMIFPELTDPLTKCFFHNTSAFSSDSKNITIEASTISMNYLSSLSSTNISTQLLIPKRRFLNAVSFQIYPTVDVNVLKEHVKQVVFVTSPSQATSSSSYDLQYSVLELIGMGTQFNWTATGCLVSGVADSPRMAAINNGLTQANSSLISSTNLADHLSVDVQVSVELAPNFVQTATATISFSSSAKLMSLVGSYNKKFVPLQTMSLLFAFLGVSFSQTNLYLIANGISLTLGTDFQANFYPETNKVLIKLIPQDIEVINLVVGYSSGDLPEALTLVKQQESDMVSFKFPTESGMTQTIPFWTNVGSDYQYQVFFFRTANNLRVMSTSLATSTFDNSVSLNLQNSDPTRAPANNENLQVILRFVSSKFDVKYITSMTARGYNVYFQESVMKGTTYRDGSNLQSSNSNLSIGVFKQSLIQTQVASDGFTAANTVTQTVDYSLSNSETSFTANFASSNLGNQLSIESEVTHSGQLDYIDTSFACYYKNTSGVTLSNNWLLKLYNPPAFTTSLSHLPAASSTQAVFEVSTSVTGSFNKFISYDSSQFLYNDRLLYANPMLTPVYLPSTDLYHLVKVDGILFNYTNSTKPSFDMFLFDFNANLPSSNQVAFSLDPSWSQTQLPVSTYVSALNSSLSAASGNDLLQQLNMATFVCNHAYLACKYNISCLSQDLPVRQLRGTLWDQFKNFWMTITDKDGYQDWTNSVLKNSFINGVTMNNDGMTDSTIDSIDQELFREVNSLITRVSASTTGLSRIAYQIQENMKPILQVTFHNLELLLSSYSHDLRLFGCFYTGLTTPTLYQTKLNDVYVKMIAVNEIKLLRYTLPSDSTVFENELVVIGGATILAPTDGNNYFFSFGDSLAVQLSNLTFNVTKDFYEMSVVNIKDEFFTELNTTLATNNLTLASGQSRTTVSFTNNFTLVGPQLNNNTLIGIYRPLSDCHGTPCDANQQKDIGKTVILCECLKPADTNIFTKALQDTAAVITNSTSQVGDAITGGITDIISDPESVSNYHFWLNSVILIFSCFTAFLFVGMALESAVITPLATGWFNKFSVEFMTSQQIKDMKADKPKEDKKDSKKEKDDDKDKKEDKDKKDEQEKKKMNDKDDERKNTEKSEDDSSSQKEQDENNSKLKKLFEEDKGVSKAFESMKEFKEMGNGRLYFLVLLTNHYVLSIFFSKCVLYSRKSAIMNLYNRVTYGLAITMAFAMGGTDGYNNYQTFVFKCLVAPVFTSVLLFALKKLMKNDANYGLSILKWCPKKTPEPSTSSLTPAQPQNRIVPSRSDIRTQSRISLNGGDVSGSSPTNTALNSPERRTSIKPFSEAKSFSPIKIETVPSDFKPTKLGVVKILGSYIVSLALLPVSALIMVTVATKTNQTGKWPVGYWYVMQLTFDLTVSQSINALIQFGLFKSHLASLGSTQKNFMTRIRGLFMNSDVKALADLNNSVAK